MIHNTHMNQWIPSGVCSKSAGAWTPTLASNVVGDVRSAADAAFTLMVPILLPSSGDLRNGARLKSIDVFYKIATADADDFATVQLDKVTLPTAQAALTGAALTATIDAGHDTAAERKAQGTHVMSVTLAAPLWMTQADVVELSMIVDAAAGTVFTFYGARANFELRVD